MRTGNAKSTANQGSFESGTFLFARLRSLLLKVGPERLPLLLAGLIFFVELCDMFLISLLPRLPSGWFAVPS